MMVFSNARRKVDTFILKPLSGAFWIHGLIYRFVHPSATCGFNIGSNFVNNFAEAARIAFLL